MTNSVAVVVAGGSIAFAILVVGALLYSALRRLAFRQGQLADAALQSTNAYKDAAGMAERLAQRTADVLVQLLQNAGVEISKIGDFTNAVLWLAQIQQDLSDKSKQDQPDLDSYEKPVSNPHEPAPDLKAQRPDWTPADFTGVNRYAPPTEKAAEPNDDPTTRITEPLPSRGEVVALPTRNSQPPRAPLAEAEVILPGATAPAGARPVTALESPTGGHGVVTNPDDKEDGTTPQRRKILPFFRGHRQPKDDTPEQEAPVPPVVPAELTHPPNEPGDQPTPPPQPQPDSPVRLEQEQPAEPDEPRHHDDGPSDESTRAIEKLTTLAMYLQAPFEPDHAGYCMIVNMGLEELRDSGSLPEHIKSLLTEEKIRQLYTTNDARGKKLMSNEVLDWLLKQGVVTAEFHTALKGQQSDADAALLQGADQAAELAVAT